MEDQNVRGEEFKTKQTNIYSLFRSVPKCKASLTYKVIGKMSKFTKLIWHLRMEETRSSVSAKYKVFFLRVSQMEFKK